MRSLRIYSIWRFLNFIDLLANISRKELRFTALNHQIWICLHQLCRELVPFCGIPRVNIIYPEIVIKSLEKIPNVVKIGR